MRLYSGSSKQFVADTARNQISEKLKESFFSHYRYRPSPAEVNSWRASLSAMAHVFQLAELMDHGVALEYQLPLTSRRLDCLVCGRDGKQQDNAVIVELKQWGKCQQSDGENLVSTWVGGAERDVLHPSAQVGQYQRYLEDAHTAFYDGPAPIRLGSCAYLHNYYAEAGDALFAEKYRRILERSPAFTADEVDPLADYLRRRLEIGEGLDVLERVEQSQYRPSKKLMDHVGRVIKGLPAYVLLDEQQVVYEKVLAIARKGFHDRKKTVLVVRGGPGTGKSVIALNLMSDLLLQGVNAQYATGSKAFTETLRAIIGSRGGIQFKYFNSYMAADSRVVDVLICDEAHRIRETSNSRFTPKAKKSSRRQVDELMDASQVLVCFVDDKQVVRPNEVGSADLLVRAAKERGCKTLDFELQAQFRCAGSDGFVNWVNNTLGIARTANVLWDSSDAFDFRIFGSPEALETAIRQKAAEGHSARMTAGFCWPWSKPNHDGTLVEDVVIGEYLRPWNAKPDSGRLAKGIPKASVWAYDPSGTEQIGCIYTAQGFEFDYVGVIFGPDLRYSFDSQSWEGHPETSYDTVVRRSKKTFVDLVKNSYRVLLSRGLKGCFVHFMDKETEMFMKSRIES